MGTKWNLFYKRSKPWTLFHFGYNVRKIEEPAFPLRKTWRPVHPRQPLPMFSIIVRKFLYAAYAYDLLNRLVAVNQEPLFSGPTLTRLPLRSSSLVISFRARI